MSMIPWNVVHFGECSTTCLTGAIMGHVVCKKDAIVQWGGQQCQPERTPTMPFALAQLVSAVRAKLQNITSYI